MLNYPICRYSSEKDFTLINNNENKLILCIKEVRKNNNKEIVELADSYLNYITQENDQTIEMTTINEYYEELKTGYLDILDQDNPAYQEKLNDLKQITFCGDQYIRLALYLYLLAAEHNEEMAEARLAYCYEHGLGVPRSLDKAIKFYQLALEHGLATALDCARLLIELKKIQEANEYLLLIIESPGLYSIEDRARAFAFLGKNYELGIEKSDTLAFKYYQESFNFMPLVGIEYLASAFKRGLGVEKSLKKVQELYSETIKKYLAQAEEGCDDACYFIGTCYLKGRGIDSNEVNIGEVDAIEYFKKGAGNNGVYCLSELAWFYTNKGPSKEAFFYAKKMAHFGDSLYQYLVGFYYENGLGVEKSIRSAITYYKKAAEKYDPFKRGDVQACLALAKLYEEGGEIEISLDQSFFYYLKAAYFGDVKAQYKVGFYYENGYGTKKSNTEALFYYGMAAENNYPEGIYAYGLCLKEGIGCRKSCKGAINCLTRVLNMNIDPELKNNSCIELGKIHEEDRREHKKAYDYYCLAGIDNSNFLYYKGRCYELGIGISKNIDNIEQALKKYKIAAAYFNDVKALYRLGLFYASGPLKYRSIEIAYMYLLKANNLGNLNAFYMLFLLQQTQCDSHLWKYVDELLLRDMDDICKKAKDGDIDCLLLLGRLLENKLTADNNPLKLAKDYYMTALEKGYTFAIHHVGRVYEKEGNLILALQFYKYSMDIFDESLLDYARLLHRLGKEREAIACLERMLENGSDYNLKMKALACEKLFLITQDPRFEKKYHYFLKNAFLDSPALLYKYALYLQKNFANSPEVIQAFVAVINSICSNSFKANAYNELGKIYEHGLEIETNKKFAFECYEKAFQLNNLYSFNIARAYKYGIGTSQNIHKSNYYYNLEAIHKKDYFDFLDIN